MAENPFPVVRISQEQMREMFNELGLQKRIENKDFADVQRHEGSPEPHRQKDLGDVKSIGTYCFDADGNLVLYTHHFESPKGDVVYYDKERKAVCFRDEKMEKAKIDPKQMVVDGIDYHLPKKKKQGQ